ncbi:hypothetical protein K2173_023136 [Erythroxylum novogranatense]|uniref:Nuclear matrix constituent protein 1-like protein n=1 Tax=Erythroxylum novogranatense TaxID=1862640 RepID=A0AAV8U7U5_9ROSI|nr:hypothetical protein K2173_023136 [Erythroxylum novogranatense]
MFTPQKKVWSGWSLTPRSGAPKNDDGSDPKVNLNGPSNQKSGDGNVLKGKNVAFGGEPVTPNGVGPIFDGGSLVDKVSKLENELFEYQYNMGLLLIEKKEWASKYEELDLAISEAKDALKRERAAHLIAISDAEKREENLRKALGVEKECVLDLEKAVREMRSENAEIKFTADSKLAEANALVNSVEEKSLEIEAKLRAADAKFAEVNRKSSEVERKSQELESREATLRRERLFFISEREAHENDLSKQREELREWERKLQEGEERLSKGQRIVNQREERANEADKTYKQKEKDLEDVQKKIDEANSILNRKEEDISNRMANLLLKEKEFDSTIKKIEKKEEELHVLEEKLKDREKVEIQKLTDEHNAVLDVKKRDFELEVQEKRKSVDDDLRNKILEVEKKEAEIKHTEEKVAKREQALDKKLEKLKEKEKEFESKTKALKEREKAVKSEAKTVENEKKQLQSDREDLLQLRAEVEKIRATNEEKLLQIHEETNRLKVSEEERLEYTRLQSELKEEIEKCRHQEEMLLKETEDLKRQKENFERQWEELDEKSTGIEKELKNISDQREKFEKQKLLEEERIRREKQAAEDFVKRELEALDVTKESFEANMKHEQAAIAEKAQNERKQLLHDIELQKSMLENDMQKRQEDMEKLLQEKEKLFEDEKERELKNINFLRDLARREMDDLKLERMRVEKERLEVDDNKKHLKEQQHDMREDIDRLGELSKKLKDHREQFIKEKERFILFVEQHKSCQNCSQITSEFVLSDLISSQEIENVDIIPTPNSVHVTKGDDGDIPAPSKQEAEIYPALVRSVSPVSWLRKCTSKIFKFSPGKRDDTVVVQDLSNGASVGTEQLNMDDPSKQLNFNENEAELSFAVLDDSIAVQKLPSDRSTGDAEPAQDQSADDHSNINSKASEYQEDSHTSDLKRGSQIRKRGRARISRTRSVKAVVQDAKNILGEALEVNDTEDSGQLKAVSRNESSLAEKERPPNARKRTRSHASQTTLSEHNVADSEGHSDSVTAGERKKRRQKAAVVQPPGGARYNLRRPKLGGTVVVAKASKHLKNDNEENNGVRSQDLKDDNGENNDVRSIEVPIGSAGVASENGGDTHLQYEKASDNRYDEADGARQFTENAALSEEVNGTREEVLEYDVADQNRCLSQSEGEDDDEEEEPQHPGEVSIGKKLWTFFTT